MTYILAGRLYAYGEGTGMTVCFADGEWDHSPINRFVLNHMVMDREAEEISSERAMKITGGKDPRDFIDAYIAYLNTPSDRNI